MKKIFSTSGKLNFEIYDFNNNEYEINIYEFEPHNRTIKIKEVFYPHCSINQSFYLKLPHVYFSVLSIKDRNRYIHLGERSASFQVFASYNPINSIDKDNVDLFVFESHFNGIACLNHQNDHKLFNNVEDLANFVISEWFCSTHSLELQLTTNYYEKKCLINKNSIIYLEDKEKSIQDVVVNLFKSNDILIDSYSAMEKINGCSFAALGYGITYPEVPSIKNLIMYNFKTRKNLIKF